MGELTPQERLQPFLLDRLRDDDPTAKMESRERRALSMQRFREAVLRDLGWLLNAKCHPAADGFANYPYVDRSVLNYGMPDLSGSTASDVPVQEITQMVRRAIETFEPRILRNTLQVRSVATPSEHGTNVISLEIRAQVWALPLPESLYVRTEVDLETGDCQLREQAG